jgi:ribonuclease M5
MYRIKEAVIVEGRYDLMKLKSFLDTEIFETSGFRIYNDAQKRNLIKKIADISGIVILTDSDASGFQIRNYIKSFVPQNKIKNAYIPNVKGKERRKDKPSKEGYLGVEGLDENVIISSLKTAGVTFLDESTDKGYFGKISKKDLYLLGLSGKNNSSKIRKRLLESLGLPIYLSTNALLSVLNIMFTREELPEYLNSLNKET